MNLSLEVIRKKTSYLYKADKNKPSGFDNNYAHNSEDTLSVRRGPIILASFPCQTVANYNWGSYKSNGKLECGDTVAPGKFQIKLFVETRTFHGRIHGIVNAVDLDGQAINVHSMQVVDGYQTGRWLIHDRYSFKTGTDTNCAWSAGCFILSSTDLESLNAVLLREGCNPGDLLDCVLREV